jgi:REP element-mobilizing transposase RayT
MGNLESSSKRNSEFFQHESQNNGEKNLYVNRGHEGQDLFSGNMDVQEYARPNIESLRNVDPYVTSYVCLVAPRFEEHELTGDLTDQLHTWLKDICTSFGWGLIFLEIQPNYLHWIMTVSIAASPSEIIKTVCQKSSINIFNDFPKFKDKNMSNEFWAPWYYVGAGEAPYSNDSIKSFLKQIRVEQGLK